MIVKERKEFERDPPDEKQRDTLLFRGHYASFPSDSASNRYSFLSNASHASIWTSNCWRREAKLSLSGESPLALPW